MIRLGFFIPNKQVAVKCIKNVLQPKTIIAVGPHFIRNTSFFNKLTAEQLWKGVTSVSNAGKKRGRGKGGDRKGKKNLNLGQKVGFGKESIVWPGLSGPIIQSNTLMRIHKCPKPYEPTVVEPKKRAKFGEKLHPLERGWSGKSINGRSVGPPESDGTGTYEDFDCVVVESKLVLQMTALFGRKRKFKSTVLTGNGKGLIGVGRGVALDGKNAVLVAKRVAIKRLMAFDFTNDYSVNHDFFCQFGKTKLFVSQKPEGYGLVCHRIIKVMCKLIGIKNIYVKVEGAVNHYHIIKAFLIGLKQQKTPQEMANEKKLHLVELREDKYYFPELIASPEACLTEREALETDTNYHQYIYGGKTVLKRKPPTPFYEKSPSYQRHLKEILYTRNHKEVRTNLCVQYGSLTSFLADRYPECQQHKGQKPKENESNESE